MSDTLWVYIDFGGDHRVARSAVSPGVSWHGPFTTWTEAKQFMWNVAMVHIDGIKRVRDGWTGPDARDRIERIGGDDG
jgi:hypothetical protein